MKKYLLIYLSFIRTGFIADLEYRANFLFRVLTDTIWYAAQIIAFDVLFKHTNSIGTWNHEKTRVFLGVLFVSDAIYMITLSDNLDRLAERVRKGDLDLLLLKPINSQFMISFQRVSTSLISNFVMASAFLIYGCSQLPDFDLSRVFWLLLLIPCGIGCLYGFRFMIAATSVIFTKADNLQFLWYQIYRLGMRPDQIYSRWIRYIILSVIPVAMVASVPARFIVGPPDLALVAWTLLWTIFIIWCSNKYWNMALRFYSSASS